MKTLKEYIIEGILDIEDNIENLSVESLIEDFIKENYEIKGNLQIKKKGNKYIVSTNGTVVVKNKNITELTNDLFEWGEVGANFYCIDCKSLKDLEGAPEKVGWNFSCGNCTSLKSLKGAPEKVEWNFFCDRCDSLQSLEGAPKKVDGHFFCDDCTSLKDLNGAPEEVGKSFSCHGCISIKSLEGAPKKVGNVFSCSKCGTKFTEEDVRAICDVENEIYI